MKTWKESKTENNEILIEIQALSATGGDNQDVVLRKRRAMYEKIKKKSRGIRDDPNFRKRLDEFRKEHPLKKPPGTMEKLKSRFGKVFGKG